MTSLFSIIRGKGNVVADALSRKAVGMGSLAVLSVEERPLAMDIHFLANSMVRLDNLDPRLVLAHMGVQSSLLDRIRGCQFEDEALVGRFALWHSVIAWLELDRNKEMHFFKSELYCF